MHDGGLGVPGAGKTWLITAPYAEAGYNVRAVSGVLPIKPRTAATEVPTNPASKPHTAAGEVPTDVPPRNAAQNAAPAVLRSRSTCSEHAVFIGAELANGRNATAIFQDLVEHHAYDGSYDAVKRFARRIRPTDLKISCRFETAIGADYVEYRVMSSAR